MTMDDLRYISLYASVHDLAPAIIGFGDLLISAGDAVKPQEGDGRIR